jgi:iron-sulfur cluster repair protein YtfE (RIC family)
LDAGSLLTSDHTELNQLLTEALWMLESHDRAEIYPAVDLFWARLAMHIRAEHLHVFPSLLKAYENREESADIARNVAVLRDDHDFFMRELADIIKVLREFNDDNEMKTYLDVLRRLEAVTQRLKAHNELEEKAIYGVVAKALESDKLAFSVEKELENIPPRFREDSHSSF